MPGPSEVETMHAFSAAAANGRRFRPARGVSAGLIAALGALGAHLLAGGSVALVPGLVVTAVALPLAVVLTRVGAVDVRRLALTAAAAQAVGHLTLMLAPSGPQHHDHHQAATSATGMLPALGLSASMLLTHLGVVVVTTAVAAGVDQAILALVWSVLGWLLLPLLGVLLLPVRHRRRIHTDVTVVPAQATTSTAAPRGPPLAALRLAPSLRLAA